jgi:hypothetical protein
MARKKSGRLQVLAAQYEEKRMKNRTWIVLLALALMLALVACGGNQSWPRADPAR